MIFQNVRFYIKKLQNTIDIFSYFTNNLNEEIHKLVKLSKSIVPNFLFYISKIEGDEYGTNFTKIMNTTCDVSKNLKYP